MYSELRGTSGQLQNELDALKNRISELTTDINNEKARLNTISTDFQTKFVDDHETRSKEFSASLKVQQDQSGATILSTSPSSPVSQIVTTVAPTLPTPTSTPETTFSCK